MPIVPTGEADNPIHISQNNDDDCLAAQLTAVASLYIASKWYNERSDALAKQDEIETRILELFREHVDRYLNVDLPRQIEAIKKAMEIPECELTCSPCVESMWIGFSHSIDYLDNHYVQAQMHSGRAVMQMRDRQYAKQRLAACETNRTNNLIRANNLAFQTYQSPFGFLANASAIQSGLAGMAGAAYAGAMSEFSYALGMMGRINNSAGNYASPGGAG